MTLEDLIAMYLTDVDSPFHGNRHVTKLGYCRLCNRLKADMGDRDLGTLKAREIKQQYAVWSADDKVSMAHALATMLRIVVGFGATILEDPDCQRLRGLLAGLRFKNARRRAVHLTSDQADDVRDYLIIENYLAVALAQAIQQDCCLRQKDVIGEWVPLDDPEPSTIIKGHEKWVRGITREEIDADMILTHQTSKRGQVLAFDLKNCPAVMEEWFSAPPSGPLIIDPETGFPYEGWKFRRIWRRRATAAGLPKNVWNMDTRAGAITGAFARGANPDDIRKFAGHQNLSTTMGYSRGSEAAIARVLLKKKVNGDE